MNRPWVYLLSVMMFALPILLYFSGEYLLGQVLFFSQLVILWGMLPFLLRSERQAPSAWSKRSLVLTLILSGALIAPFLLRLAEREMLKSTDILQSSARLFSETAEALLILGSCLATVFVIAVLIKRRKPEEEAFRHD